MDRGRVEGFRWKIGMTNVLAKDCHGKSGGLMVFWKRGVNLRAISQLYMDVDVIELDGYLWRFTGFYSEPSSKNKDLSKRALHVLNATHQRPWLFAVDFNEVLLGSDKCLPWPQICRNKLREALVECALTGHGIEGNPLTWRNNSQSQRDTFMRALD